uniref:Uncharacterized protein n=1 Tax=Rhizophora mucronata TaxID=61149 RepID=A0A2P2QS53_RHIMU
MDFPCRKQREAVYNFGSAVMPSIDKAKYTNNASLKMLTTHMSSTGILFHLLK